MTGNPLTTHEITAALRVNCPYCKAPASVPCHGRGPDTRRGPHPERVAAGSDAATHPELDDVAERSGNCKTCGRDYGPEPAGSIGLSDPPPIDREELHRAITSIRESLQAAPAHGPARHNIARRLIIIEDKLAGGHGRITL